jgi:hypothetical protein
MIMNELGDLQAQVVALRVALEGAWLSMLTSGPDAIPNAQRLREHNLEALGKLDASTPDAILMRDAVVAHTDQLWKSIAWQLGDDSHVKKD